LAYHHDKSDALWNFFKNRMGISTAGTAQAHINHIFPQVDHLHSLNKIFTMEKIDGVVRHLKANKEPRPDGLDGCS
jgi:hypothetical protein